MSYDRKEANRRSAKQWVLDHPERAREKVRKWREVNPDRVRGYKRSWVERNKQTLAFKDAERRRRTRQSKRRRAAWEAARRAAQCSATPKWSDLTAIGRFYEGCPAGFHVDHIVPIRNKAVCGLHVLWNLQYLSAKDNIRKRNKFVPMNGAAA